MSKFTPGPWEARRNSAYWEVDPVRGGEGDIPYEVADVCGSAPGNPDGGLQEANARLIAAAPEMYEALEAAKTRLEQLLGKGYSTDDLILLGQIDDALAKATGND